MSGEARLPQGEGDAGAGEVPGTTPPGDVPRSARALVAVVLVALLVPGVVGFDLWPLTAWRLFSLSRGDTSSGWALQGVEGDGDTRLVNLEELPLGYRHAEWPMRSVPSMAPGERDELCRALADAAVEADPTLVELRIVRDRRELVEVGGRWQVRHDLDVRHTCTPGEEG